MAHVSITEEELLRILNTRLATFDKCVGCKFTSVLHVKEAPADACNWTAPNLRCSGVPALPCETVARAVVAEIAAAYSVSE